MLTIVEYGYKRYIGSTAKFDISANTGSRDSWIEIVALHTLVGLNSQLLYP